MQSIWPDNVKDWVSLIGGILGGVLGTSAFVLSIYNYRRDRMKLHFSASMEGSVRTSFVALRVTNIGRRPAYFTQAWIIWLDGDQPSAIWFDQKVDEPTPVVLAEQGVLELRAEVPDSITLRDVLYFGLYDNAYREYRYYPRNRWFSSLHSRIIRFRQEHQWRRSRRH
jgi:hypothetical protein